MIKDTLANNDELLGYKDPLFNNAVLTCINSDWGASIFLIQQHFQISYNRAVSIFDAMIQEGFVGEIDEITGVGSVLISLEEFEQHAEKLKKK